MPHRKVILGCLIGRYRKLVARHIGGLQPRSARGRGGVKVRDPGSVRVLNQLLIYWSVRNSYNLKFIIHSKQFPIFPV